MNINDYKYIVTIAELGSFTKAAQELFIAQPSLSQRVKHIEAEYEIHIFLRDKKGIQLTPEGEVFVKYANRILQNEDDLKKTIYDMHNTENKPLRVGIPQFINTPFFKQLIRTYHKEFPLYQLEFLENTSLSLQQQLLSGEIDLAICYLPVSSPDIKYEVIINDNIVLVPAVDGELSHKIR